MISEFILFIAYPFVVEIFIAVMRVGCMVLGVSLLLLSVNPEDLFLKFILRAIKACLRVPSHGTEWIAYI